MEELDIDWEKVDKIIECALNEDIGPGDITTEAICPSDSVSKAIIKAKEKGVIAGVLAAQRVFQKLSADITFNNIKSDGQTVAPGDVIMEIDAPTRAVLTGERLALNILQRLSGIATETSKYVRECRGFKAQILDTRKTAPCLRVLDKYAVRAGGGKNHRIGLYDAVLIKDNHIALAGGISNAVSAVRRRHGSSYRIEVETSNLTEVREALDSGADIIMLDNMSNGDMLKAVSIIKGKAVTEASGGVTLDSVRAIAETGVDYISVGYVTHSAKALDIALYLV